MARGAGRVSESLATSWLDQLAAAAKYLSLNTSDPHGASDPATVEPQGGVYARSLVTWARSGRLLRNSNALSWVGIQQGTVITHISGWDSAFNGTLIFSTPVPALTYAESTTGGLIIPVNEFFVGLDV